MSPLVVAALGGLVVAALLHKSDPHRQLVVGSSYVATFQPPSSLRLTPDVVANIQSIVPQGSALSVNDSGQLVVRFTSVSSAAMGDIPTPLGNLTLVSLKDA